jgi:hypothetical protein
MYSIVIGPDGQMEFINNNGLAELLSEGEARITRASHVEPLAPVKRLAFRVIRRLVADDSRIAAWTRNWKGPWVADLALSGGPVLAGDDGDGFASRADAIAAEVAWINQHVFHV